MTEFRDADGFSLIGASCTYKFCGERDYLPFKCEFCGKSYCVKHADPRSHDCENWTPQTAEITSVRVIICPICAKPIRYDHNDPHGAEVAWASHEPECSGAADEIPRCPVEGCKAKLTSSGSVACTTCGLRVCLKHRYEDMHPCRGVARAAGTARPPAGRMGWLASLEGKPVPKPAEPKATTESSPAVINAQGQVSKSVDDSHKIRAAVSAAFREMDSKVDAVRKETCCKTLLKIFENITGKPQEPKFRKLNSSNAAIASKVLSIPGGTDVLMATGWCRIEGGQVLELPMGVQNEHLQIGLHAIRSQLAIASAAVAAAAKASTPPQAIASAAALSETEPWSCKCCTLINAAEATVCSACGNSK